MLPANDVGAARAPVNVDIYVIEHCAICRYSLEVAAMIRAEFPAVTVRVITLGATNEEIPECVFATPTYLLNGERWSLGNPSPAQVRQTLGAALAGRSR